MISFLLAVRFLGMVFCLMFAWGGFKTAIAAKKDNPNDPVQFWTNVVLGSLTCLLLTWGFIALWRWEV